MWEQVEAGLKLKFKADNSTTGVPLAEMASRVKLAEAKGSARTSAASPGKKARGQASPAASAGPTSTSAAGSDEAPKKRKNYAGPETGEDAPVGETAHPKKSGCVAIAKGAVPDIGAVVKAKVKDKWYTAVVVKHERHGAPLPPAVGGGPGC